ncbi:hypothetical protein C1I63_11925 [Rathayibacter caricis DSM 15933]|uniref:D-inositol 3-phosphate glycosyltransferase n=1 Tax=Rathayibacter caricis DSM 15933 TaxID=1328867 RepID=A0A2T4UVF0_9MICO|nr:hypothetical protein [Rathayibacter caricis]PTL73483.1 hypothetical protein C1I63_11925 [Rathayibacter caricis DSM 15933]
MSRPDSRKSHRVVVVNPLGGTLLHYTEALRELLVATGCEADIISFDEPSASGASRQAWLVQYLRALWTAVRRLDRGGRLIVTWPVLGYWDFLFLAVAKVAGARPTVVLHDPEPLVHAVGYSAVPRWLARLTSPRSGLIVHSHAAHSVIETQSMGAMTTVLPHPVRNAAGRGDDDRRGRTVRVLGQFKPDRDTALLESIAALRSGDVTLEVWGRGWPEISGWDVHEGFVSEQRLDELVRTAGAVLVPYRRFYQSGIAIRALECQVPFVGPRASSLADLYDASSPLLVPAEEVTDGSAWWRSIRAARAMTSSDLESAAREASRRTVQAWRTWLLLSPPTDERGLQ